MSWWKKVVEFFTGPTVSDEEEEAPKATGGTPLERATWQAVLARIGRKERFSALDIARDATAPQGYTGLSEAVALVDTFFERGLFEPHHYARTRVSNAAAIAYLYHPEGETPTASYVPPPIPSSLPIAAPKSAPVSASQPADSSVRDAYDVGEFLTLTPSELRARALKIQPWRTGWIGRVDVIPPESDERTALIDRGLELRGLLSRAELVEIHRVGDLWLAHHDRVRLVRAKAAKNADEAVAQLRIERQRKREEKRAEAATKKAERIAAIAKRRQEDIIHLGRGVSAGLADRRALVEKLMAKGLPVLATPHDIAKALELTIPELRQLAFHADASRVRHYVEFDVPKRSSGTRRLAAPLPRMHKAQRWILEHVLDKLEVSPEAHGFVKGRSTVTAARPHAGQDVVMNLDLKDFFPSITFPRVRGLFQALGYSPAVATIFALLCTESPRVCAEFAGVVYYVAAAPRALPQGACTSPALSNQIVRKLDRRLEGTARARGWTYTRYADDLSFSAPAGKREDIGRLMARVRHVAEEEGFVLNPQKGRVQKRGGRMDVTGVVVNDPNKLGVPREEVRRLRAILHNAKKTGLEAQNRAGNPHFAESLRGKIAYVQMIDRERGAALVKAFNELPPRAR